MSDARSLLRAKRQEVRVNHPLATYTSSGQLRCVACGINIKQGTSWEGHVGSKQHRTSAIRLKEEEHRRAQEELTKKRKEQSDEEDEGADTKRRRVDGPADGDDDDDDEAEQPTQFTQGAFPANFFSDPSRAPPPPSEYSDEEGGLEEGARSAPPAPPAKSAIDKEWEQFQAAIIDAPDVHETYERATVFAEPVLASEVPEGFPLRAMDAEEGGEEAMVDEAAMRKQREYDDRELIMDRLLEEERAQEEADAKVTLLKARLEAVRRQREARKVAKAKSGQT